MLRGVELEVAAATNSSACESPHSASSDSDSPNAMTTDKADWGILNYDCIAEPPKPSRCSRGAHGIAASSHARATRGSSLP